MKEINSVKIYKSFTVFILTFFTFFFLDLKKGFGFLKIKSLSSFSSSEHDFSLTEHSNAELFFFSSIGDSRRLRSLFLEVNVCKTSLAPFRETVLSKTFERFSNLSSPKINFSVHIFFLYYEIKSLLMFNLSLHLEE